MPQPLIIVVNKDYWKLSEYRGHALLLSRLWQEMRASGDIFDAITAIIPITDQNASWFISIHRIFYYQN